MKQYNWRDRSLEKLSKQSIFIQATLGLLLSIMIMLAGYQLFIKSRLEQRQMLHDQQILLMDYFSQKQKRIATLPQVELHVSLLQKQWNSLISSLPENFEMPQFLKEITRIGHECTLVCDTIVPKQNEEMATDKAYSFQLIIKGSYAHLAMFLSQLTRLSAALDLQNFTMVSSEDEVQMAITIKIYRMKV